MNKLSQIVETKRAEVEQLKLVSKISDFEASTYFNRVGKSLKKSLLNKPGVITEFKRSSPSAGSINNDVKVQAVVRGYDKAGASGISILTDKEYFGGSLEDLSKARQVTELPLLRKDFIIDEFQIYEAKANGADVILLIAEILEEEQVRNFAELAKKLKLEVLLEVHSVEELSKVNEFIDLVGVNNRNLTTFEVDLNNSKELAKHIPNSVVKISESGFDNPEDVMDVNRLGFQGFLIGGHFMEQEHPAEAAKLFIEKLI